MGGADAAHAAPAPGSVSAALEASGDVIAVHPRDEVDGDLLRADRFAFAIHRAASEVLLHHFDHPHHAIVALGLSLRQESEVRDFGGSEKLGCAVWTLSDASAAFNAFGGVHGPLLNGLRNQDAVRFRRAAGIER